MANKFLITPMDGTPKQIVFADHAGDFSPVATDLRVTTDGSFELDVEFEMASVANAAGRQSAKFDFGAKWAQAYAIRTCLEMAATPTAGNLIELYFGFSHDSTPANDNPANLTGVDAAYAGYSSNLAASVKQLYGPFFHTCTVQVAGTEQVGHAGVVYPQGRYGMLALVNNSGAAFHTDDVECHIVLDPIVQEAQ